MSCILKVLMGAETHFLLFPMVQEVLKSVNGSGLILKNKGYHIPMQFLMMVTISYLPNQNA